MPNVARPLALLVLPLLTVACAEEVKKALSESDLGFGSPAGDGREDDSGYTIEAPPSLDLGPTEGAGGADAGLAGSDAAPLWAADAATAGAGGEPANPPGGPCTDGERQACEAQDCVGGVQICREGQWSDCSPPPEACNDRDDDCDGEIDENFPSVGQPCQAGGDCQGEGVVVCRADGTGVECQLPEGSGGTPEICDGQDNDCDGTIDEDFGNERCCLRSADCGPGQTCDETGHCIGGDTPVGPGEPGGPGDFGFGSAPLAPPGAACETAQDIPGPGEYPGATAGNGDEGLCTFFPTGGGEMAYTITRGEDTTVHLYAYGDLFVNTVLYVRTDCLDPFSEVACNDDTEEGLFNFDAETEFTAEAGQTYYVIVDSWGAGGTFTLIVDERRQGGGPGPGPGPDEPDAGAPPPPPPPPEPIGTCALPVELPLEGSVSGDTRDGGDALGLGCTATETSPEAVLRFRIDHPARVIFDTQGSDFDTVLGVRTACESVASEFACNDDNGGGGMWSRAAVDLDPDVDYFVIVDGYRGDGGAFTVTAHEDFAQLCSPNGSGCAEGEACFATTCEAIPAGLCADARPLRPEVPARGNIDRAGPDNVPTARGCGGQHGPEHVYAFIPETDGEYGVTTEGSATDTVLSVYDGCGAEVGGAIGCNDDGAGASASLVTFPAQAGHMYFAVVEGYNGRGGEYQVYFGPLE